MNEIQVETAQNVQIYQNVASLGSRIGAYLLDILVVVVYELLMFFIYNSLLTDSYSDRMHVWVISLVFGLPPFLYHLLMEIFNNGQSIGKAVMQIRVVRLDGMSPRFSNYLVRWLLRIVDFSLSSGALAVFVFLLSGKGQRLGDIAAKTTVISEKKTFSIEDTLLISLPENYLPTHPQVTIFTDLEIQKIKDMYHRAKQNQDDIVIGTLATKIASVMDIKFEEAPMAFIERVISDYSYYTQQ